LAALFVGGTDDPGRDDLTHQRVVYMLFRNDFWSQKGLSDPSRHYGITSNFISQYMSFADNSLVYVDACDGARDQVRDAFKNKNGSLFVGWNERAEIGVLGKTARYVFDRLLGANKFAPESPEQRPFGYDALKRDPKFVVNKRYGYSEASATSSRTAGRPARPVHGTAAGWSATLGPVQEGSVELAERGLSVPTRTFGRNQA